MIKILNQQRELVAILENAYAVGYTKRSNEMFSASFSLPLDDVKNAECQPFNFVDITDDYSGEYVGLFRIIPTRTVKNDTTNEITYECEHVISTLLDDVLFSEHITEALSTAATIQYLLDQQAVKHWQIGNIGIARYFSYKWENENILSALFSITKPFDVPLRWTYDTSTYPWTLNLVEWPAEPVCEVRYGKNLRGVEREVDPTVVVNRWYALGYGEGVNQLRIDKVNPTGLPYVEDAASVAKYGLISDFFVDKSIEDAELLFNTVKAVLATSKEPKVSYRVSVADMAGLTKEDADKIREGNIVRVVDPDIGTFNAPVVSEAKSDITGQPYEMSVEIANKRELFGDEVNAERSRRINELYAQGATNFDSHDYNDNADPLNPASIRFYLPEEMVRVNKLDLTFETTAFRTYGRATKGGGATTATSSSGGGVSTSTSSGGGSTQTSSSGGGTNVTSSNVNFNGVTLRTGIPEGSVTPPYELHEHLVVIVDSQLAHEHSVSIPNHTHSVTVPNHTHDFTVPGHSHSVTIPDHTHDIEHGIFKLTQLPTAVTIKVDGNTVPFTEISGTNIDLIPYLSIDANEKVVRGWHTIEITPNDLGRITAQITTQFFIQSRGGGNY
jgi:phage minor structural protein